MKVSINHGYGETKVYLYKPMILAVEGISGIIWSKSPSMNEQVKGNLAERAAFPSFPAFPSETVCVRVQGTDSEARPAGVEA